MAKPVDTLDAHLSVSETIAFFTGNERRHKSYPVVAKDGTLAGMVSRADVLRWLPRQAGGDGWQKNATLGDIQTCDDMVVGYADELVGHLADRMAARDVGRVPIVDRATRHVVGLVARRDLLRVRARLVSEEGERRKLLTLAG